MNGDGRAENLSCRKDCPLSKDKEACCVYDYNTQYTVCFSVKEALGGGNPVQDVIRMEEVESERPVEHRFYQVLALSDNRFLGFGNHFGNRIQIFNQSKVLATYSDFPVLDEKEENNRSLWGVIWRLLVYLLTKNILS